MITDPAFYAVAVPAVLLMGLSKSGFASGFGSLATPLMALAIPVPQAAAVMLPLLLVMDVVGVQALWRAADRSLLKLLLPAGLLGTVIGTLVFGLLSRQAVSGVVGGLTLLFLLQRLCLPPRADGQPPSRGLGRVLGVAAGFTSFVVHAGGPPINAYLLPLRLKPVVYTATMAILFAALNLSKWVPYAWLGLINLDQLSTALVLAPLAPVGVWGGIWLSKRIQPTWFYRIAYTGMACTATKLIWDSWH